jgi:hypothetical protein
MSDIETNPSKAVRYDYWGPVFYLLWGHDEEVMRQAREANDFANIFLTDGKSFNELSLEIQQAIHDKAEINIKLGDD